MLQKLGKKHPVHFIGIKGTGMATLAVNLKQMGWNVSGSDHAETFFTDRLLAKHGLRAKTPFAPENIPPAVELVVTSTAYTTTNNRELAAAQRQGLPIKTYPEMLGLITRELSSIAVCGSHGKTTTSGMIGYLFSQSRYHPLINVGSIVPQLIDYNATKPKLFIFEADEYQNKLQYFQPWLVVLTNIDYDHPDYFKDAKHYQSVFRDFVKRIPANGLLVYCNDDKNASLAARSAKCRKISYGFGPKSEVRLSEVAIADGFMTWQLRGKVKGQYTSRLLGAHNALNLTAALICGQRLKLGPRVIARAVENFLGTTRRMETKKAFLLRNHKVLLIDDYAHHPTEIRATLAALKLAYPKFKLWTVFQPHTFSRTAALFNDFARAFAQSDETIILDIYASKRETEGKIHSRDLVKKMLKGNGPEETESVRYRADLPQAAAYLKQHIQQDSLILTLGASNVWELERYF